MEKGEDFLEENEVKVAQKSKERDTISEQNQKSRMTQLIRTSSRCDKCSRFDPFVSHLISSLNDQILETCQDITDIDNKKKILKFLMKFKLFKGIYTWKEIQLLFKGF